MTTEQFSQLRERACALRRAGKSRREIREILGVRREQLVNALLAGEPAPAWTRRPNAKDDARVQARELRRVGLTYREIATQLNVSQSSVSLWVRDLPKPAPKRNAQEHAAHMNQCRWEPERHRRESERQQQKLSAAREVGAVSARELLLAGAALYWAEGTKEQAVPQARTCLLDQQRRQCHPLLLPMAQPP